MADKMQTRQYTEFQFVAGTTGKTLTVHDADVAQWLEDIIDERDELVQMGALDGRKLTEEINALRHDIARHVQIASEQAQEIEALRRALHEIAEEWAGAECGMPVTAQEAYAIELVKRMARMASEALGRVGK